MLMMSNITTKVKIGLKCKLELLLIGVSILLPGGLLRVVSTFKLNTICSLEFAMCIILRFHRSFGLSVKNSMYLMCIMKAMQKFIRVTSED